MSQAAGASSWTRRDGPGAARERVRAAVAALTRARRLQVLLDHGFGGLLAGLCVATAAVLVARLVPLPYAPGQLTGAAVIVALAVALLIGWQRRPAALEVAIRADLTLRLKQRLSTAWEFITVRGDDELTGRLAVQAVNAGLSARPGMVFPLRVNRWGRLAPLAAAALLLASVADLNGMRASAPREVDEQVVGEGRRLGEFGRAMQERAQRDELPRSERQSAQLERLGARMEGGVLSRGQALEQLRQTGQSLEEERMQARAEAGAAGIGPLSAESGARLPIAPGLSPGAMLERLQRGALESADIRALAGRVDALERSGIPRRELEDAFVRHRAGADDALREILEKLARLERALKEDRELRGAREQVRRARENLGESLAGADGRRGPGAEVDWDEEEERGVKSAANVGADGRTESRTAQGTSGSGSQRDTGLAADRQRSPLRPDAGPSGPVLNPESPVREGEVFVIPGRVLPTPGRPGVENVRMKREFASQVEEVLSQERYPAHYKEFIRRYFLTLSQGERVPQQPSPGTRGAP